MKNNMRIQLKITGLLLILFQTFSIATFANSKDPDSTESRYNDWHNKDPKQDKIYGVSTDRAYKSLLKGKRSRPVLVAIIDSGIDIDHEDIKDKIWVNEDEIPGNGIDDDRNGYIDDIHGWNFLGNSKGENVEHETYELTRLYKKYDNQFKNRIESDIKEEEKADYKAYLKVKDEYEKKLMKAEEEDLMIKNFEKNFNMVDMIVSKYLGKEDYTLEDLKNLKTTDKDLLQVKEYMVSLYEKGFSKQEIKKYKEHYQDQLNYHLNVDYNPRTIIGDDPENSADSLYGNPDVEGASPEHGTHVAGIIGANRENGIGVKGVAENVKLMALRAVPDGDERDKDIANAIRYAVNNGAQIINMSFGKSYSPQKQAVDEAIKYAERRGVLSIHAAGNDAVNIDTTANYPTKVYSEDQKEASNWITVGASAIKADESLPGYFSNYGKKSVDLFAPGVEIYSLKPDNRYTLNSGTSMACPVVSGVAALVLSYYPTISAQQLKEILLKSSVKYSNLKVNIPTEGDESEEGDSKKKTVKFEELSQTGGVVNAYEALKLAEKFSKGKEKINLN
jgi:subtilisin family serine protease